MRPFLEAKFNNSWPDPKAYADKEAFLYSYNAMWGWAQAGKEFLSWVDQQCRQFDALLKKQNDETESPFRIGK